MKKELTEAAEAAYVAARVRVVVALDAIRQAQQDETKAFNGLLEAHKEVLNSRFSATIPSAREGYNLEGEWIVESAPYLVGRDGSLEFR